MNIVFIALMAKEDFNRDGTLEAVRFIINIHDSYPYEELKQYFLSYKMKLLGTSWDLQPRKY